MRAFRLFVILTFAAVLLLIQHYGPASSPASHGASTQSGYAAKQGEVPQKALWVLKIIRETGHAPEGYVGGRIFQNREHRLPPDDDYREFDVDPHDGHRNAERLIVEWQSKKAWYTGDHYQTFIPIP